MSGGATAKSIFVSLIDVSSDETELAGAFLKTMMTSLAIRHGNKPDLS